MCLHPVQIRNPNYGLKPLPGSPASLRDCTSQYLNVPCGHCSQCVALRQMYLVERTQCESFENHLFFATLTYNPESLPKMSVSSGYDIPFADVRDLQNTFKRLRKSQAFTRPFRYLAVCERGSERGRPHFHVLFSIPKYEGDSFLDCLNLEGIMFDALLYEWRRNYGSSRKPVYRPLCTFYRKFIGGKLSSSYDLHYVEPSLTDAGFASVAFYITKYMLKPSEKEVRLQQALRLNLPEEEYEDVWPIIKSRLYTSHNYGCNPSALRHVHESVQYGIDAKKYDFPVFINPDTGQTFPLAPFYSRRGEYYSFNTALKLYYGRSTDRIDTVSDRDPLSISQINKKVSDYEKTLSKTSRDVLDSLFAFE